MRLQASTKIIRNKVGLLNLAQELGNISQACRSMGFSRDTFYRYQDAIQNGGIEALVDKSRRKGNHKNRVPRELEEASLAVALEQPAWGQVRASNELRQRGISISPTGVRGVWIRLGLETFKKRLGALEKKSALEGLVLTEAQLAAMERRKEEQESCGKIETEHLKPLAFRAPDIPCYETPRISPSAAVVQYEERIVAHFL
jgi:transposase